MKPLNKMNDDEIKDLLVYSTTSVDLYYSNISQITKTHITYNREEYAASPDHLELISKGKIKYELYALAMSSSNAEEMLKTQAEAILKEQFSADIRSFQDELKGLVSITTDNVSEIVNTLSENIKSLKDSNDLQDSIKKVSTQLNDSVQAFDPKAIQAKIDSKLDDLKDIKKDAAETVGKLKELFK